MASSLFQSLGNSSANLGNLQGLVNQFKQFQSSFSGNAREQVQQLLNSGKMTQEQFNRLAQTANQLQSLLK